MTESFLKGPLDGQLFRFALPVAFTIICEQLVNGTDVFVLGKFVGPAATLSLNGHAVYAASQPQRTADCRNRRRWL